MPYLFSYGTLQQPEVQDYTFGRRPDGQRDELIGYRMSCVEIGDPEVVAASGKAHHPIILLTGETSDCVRGTVFHITEGELADVDRYESDAYERVAAELVSGIVAWVFVDARGARADPNQHRPSKP